MDLYVTEYGIFSHLKCTQRSTTQFFKKTLRACDESKQFDAQKAVTVPF